MTADPHNCTGEVFVSHYNNTNNSRDKTEHYWSPYEQFYMTLYMNITNSGNFFKCWDLCMLQQRDSIRWERKKYRRI